MKITITDRADTEEDEIIIRCRNMDDQLLKLIYAIKAGQEKLTGMRDGNRDLVADPRGVFFMQYQYIHLS